MQLYKFALSFNTHKCTLLIFAWSIGLTLGICAEPRISGMLPSCLMNACFSNSTLVVPSALVPITLVWLVTKYSMHGLIYPILFCKAYFDGLLFCAIGVTFGSASWLMGILLLFTDRLATVFLICFSIQCLYGCNYRINRWYVAFLLLIVSGMATDYFCISRSLIHLML